MGGVCPNASKNGQISPPTTVRAARGDGSCPNCASALQGAREIANIQAGSGVIWRIPVYILSTADTELKVIWPARMETICHRLPMFHTQRSPIVRNRAA